MTTDSKPAVPGVMPAREFATMRLDPRDGPAPVTWVELREWINERDAQHAQDRAARDAEVERLRGLLQRGLDGCDCRDDCSHAAQFEAEVSAFLAAFPSAVEAPAKAGGEG